MISDSSFVLRVGVFPRSIRQKNMEKSKIVVQSMAAFAAVLSMGCAGFHLGWSSPSLPKLLADDSDIPITSGESSWIVSFYEFGAAIGLLISFVPVDRWGRKFTLLLTVVPYLVSCILLGAAQSYWWFLVARFTAGLGAGITYIPVTIYLAEIANDRIRGALITLLGVITNSGCLLAYSVGPWMGRVAFAALGGVLPVIFGLMFVFMPESPYFLVMKGKLDLAEKSLKRLRESNDVDEELKKVQASVQSDYRNAGTVKELLMVPGNRKAVMICLGLVVGHQCSGIFAVQAYASLIFEESGSTLDSSVSVIIVGIIQVIAGVLTMFVMDLAGRRPLLFLSASGSILFLVGEALYFQLRAAGADVTSVSWIPLTFMVAYLISYTMGLGCLVYIVSAELLPLNVKALGLTGVLIISSLIAMAVGKLYQIVADAYGMHVCFWGFAVVTLITVTALYFILPETKQRSLRSIHEELNKSTEPTIESEELETA